MKKLKIGDKVKIKDSGEKGIVIATNDEKIHVQTDVGEIIKVGRDAVILIEVATHIVNALGRLFKAVLSWFKQKKQDPG